MISTVIIISLVCNGLYIAMGEGMILGWFDKLIGKLPSFLNKPLGKCIYCMASFYGIIVCITMGTEWHLIPVCITAAIFTNGLFCEIILLIQKYSR